MRGVQKTMRRVAVIADLHFGASGDGAAGALEAALAVAAPDLLVIAGDFTQHGSVAEFQQAAAMLDRLAGTPIVAVPGNHDVPQRELLHRFARPLGRYNRSIAPRVLDRYRDDEIAVIGINSARAFGLHWNWAHGRVSPRDIASASAWLADRPAGAFVALVVHHPPVLFEPRRGFRRLGRGTRLLGALGAVGADAVMSGHLHRTGWRTIDGLVHLHVGTGMSSRVRGEANTFCTLDIDADSIDLRTWIAAADGGFAHGETVKLERRGAQDTKG